MTLQTTQAGFGGADYTALEALSRKSAKNQNEDDYLQVIRDKINEMYDKVKNNETEEKFQIGSNSFTEKEWNKFLEVFDDIQQTIRELMREEHAKREEERLEAERLETEGTAAMAEDSEEVSSVEHIKNAAVDTSSLVSESVFCEYPSAGSESENVMYVVWYNETGIYCKKLGDKKGCEWVITFDGSEQYQQVKAFMERFDADDNLRFAPNQNFWQDFFAGKFDVEEFVTFFEESDNGTPNYLVEREGSMFIDSEKAKWAPYMNKPGAFTMYTAEEMAEYQAELIEFNLNNGSGVRQVTLDRNALFSICHVPTGESANVYRAADFSVNNPVYKVTGVDANGNEYEQEINVNDINPNNCSYLEMLAWSVHTGKNSPSDYLALSRLRSEAGSNSYHEKTDYLAIVRKLMEEMKAVGSLNDYLHYEKWLEELEQ